jgi:electron-transferring-flavoprotein dehydrogenase
LYAGKNNLLSLGLVVGLSYEDPWTDPHREFQRLKSHPDIASILKGGKLIRFGAKALPEGGYYSIPKPYHAGALIVGDSAGFLNSQRLKGIHLAMKSGMLAAEAIYEALKRRDFSEQQLSCYERLIGESWMHDELYRVRNFHQAMDRGLWTGSVLAGLQMATGGRGLKDRLPSMPGHARMRKLNDHGGSRGAREQGCEGAGERGGRGAGERNGDGFKPDGTLTFDKLTDVYYSGTSHDEDQPCHLKIADFDICHNRCTVEYANPCQRFCPANVYEMIDDKGAGKRLQINASNCVHCKTCDIMDPYQIITWVPPEGGGGPNYVNL